MYWSAARRMRNSFDELYSADPFEAVSVLVVSQFNMSLAVELMAKAYHLRVSRDPPESVYTHQVRKLLPSNLLSSDEMKLVDFASQTVEWAGRYPTPKWDREPSREKYDVSSTKGGHFDANNLPNRASLQLVDALDQLFQRIHKAWAA